MLPLSGKRYLLIWLLFPAVAIAVYPYISELPQGPKIITTILSLVIMFFSVLIHEVSHGFASFLGGDDTAYKAKRLTFNPFDHVSLFGSILLPLLLFLTHAPVMLGWAKPVPLNPTKLRQYPRDQLFAVLAGPVSNLLLAYIGFTLFCFVSLIFRYTHPTVPIPYDIFTAEPGSLADISGEAIWFVLYRCIMYMMLINASLAIFNLIPFPPLDGFWLFKALFPPKITAFLTRIQPYGFILIVIVLQTGIFTYLLYPVWILVGLFTSVLSVFNV